MLPAWAIASTATRCGGQRSTSVRNWLEAGYRLLNRYHHQHEVGAGTDAFKDAVNPYFDAISEFETEIQGSYQPAEWGTYELIAKIPAAQLSTLSDAWPSALPVRI
jgi:hypothetical protein